MYSQKRWFAEWIEGAEKEETRQKRVVDVVTKLKEAFSNQQSATGSKAFC